MSFIYSKPDASKYSLSKVSLETAQRVSESRRQQLVGV